MAHEIGLHSLKPTPGSRHRKKRVGRGEGSGIGKTSGRGENGGSDLYRRGRNVGGKQRRNLKQCPKHHDHFHTSSTLSLAPGPEDRH